MPSVFNLVLRALLAAGSISAPAPSPTPSPPPSSAPVVAAGAKQFYLTSTNTGSAPFTMGYAFARGDIPSGTGVIADSVSNIQVKQMNAWPDGSLKLAIISGTVSLTSGSTLKVTLSSGTATAGTALTTTNLKATSVTASVACGSFGTVSWATTDWDTPFATHVSGPQMSSWIYRKPVGSDAHLVAWLEVRLYLSGAVEILPWIENGYLKVASPTNKSATYVFTLGGTQRSSQAIDLPSRCRTPLVAGTALSYWLGTDPAVTIRHDTDYLQSTEVVPPYMAVVSPTHSAVTGLPSTYTPMQQGSFAYSGDNMGGTGYATPIGLMPQHDALYLTCTAPNIYSAVIRNGYSAGRYPIHYRDEATNRPLKFSSHPNLSSNASSVNDLTASASGTSPPGWELAHHPSVGFMAYLLTGRYYFIEQVQFAATANYLSYTDLQRNFANGWTVPIIGGQQVRGAAWGTRTLLTAALISPDADSALTPEFINSISATATHYYNQYVIQSNNPFGFIQSDVDYAGGYSGARLAAATGWMSAAWMQDFFTASVGWACSAGLNITSTVQTQLAAFFAWTAQSAIGRLGATNTGTDYLFTEAAPYNVNSAADHNPDWTTGTGPWPSSWNAIYQVTKNVAAQGSTTGPQRDLFFENANTLHQIAVPEAEGYYANLQPAIAYAVRQNVPGAAAAYNRLTGATNWSNMTASFNNDSCVWAIKPLNSILPSWLFSAPLYQWVDVPNSIALGTAADIDGGLSVNSRLAYSSYSLKDTLVILAATGGHTDYQKNQVTAIDIGVNSPAWQLLLGPSPSISVDVAYNPDGKPVAAHRGQGVWWSKETNKLLLPYSRYTPVNALSFPASNGFDLTTNSWDSAGTWADAPGIAHIEDDDGNLYCVGANYFDIYKFVPSTNVWSLLYHSGPSLACGSFAWDSKRKQLFGFSYGDGQGAGTPGLQAFVFSPTNPSAGATFITLNASSAYTSWLSIAPLYQSVEYDKVNDFFLVYCPINNTDSYLGNGGTTIYKVVPNNTTAWDISVLAVTGTPPAKTEGTQGRLRYVPKLGGFLCMPSGTAVMKFIKTSS